ncbi:prepilin peptidase [Candidatus Pantoea persica]|uniref:prepilin peptidase n=1 Tax=Candidatus Pantoea persica TaxID=2518128 RepID=UPI00215DBDD5|nr:prepilin peptidase [Candidatus Pantoea persica]MBA2816116.1 putative pectic enzymes secretion protein OutO [Candidatus Pantoea persica]
MLALLLALRLPWDGALLALLLSVWLLALSLIDLRWQLLPDSLTLSLLWLGLLFHSGQRHAAAQRSGQRHCRRRRRLSAVPAAGVGISLLASVRGLGGGAKLLTALGAWLGWEKLPLLLLLIAASTARSAVLLARLLMWCPCSLPLPFGRCLALAGALLLHAPG